MRSNQSCIIIKEDRTIHDLIFLRHPEWYKPVDRWIYNHKFRKACINSDKIIAVSQCTKQDIIELYKIEPEKIEVVYQGCDPLLRKKVSESENASDEENAASDAEKTKLAVAFDKGKDFMTRHGNIWQIVKFTLISLIAFLAEFASMYALQYGLEDVLGNQEFHWFVFHYAPGRNGAFGTAGFIAMLVSKCIAEIISFTINRKKTFNANNNVVFSAIMYIITVIALILFTTWLAGILGDAIGPAIGADLGNTISKMLGSLISWVVIFLMDKFVIMRKVDKGEAAEENAEAALAADAEENEAVTEISSGDRE